MQDWISIFVLRGSRRCIQIFEHRGHHHTWGGVTGFGSSVCCISLKPNNCSSSSLFLWTMVMRLVMLLHNLQQICFRVPKCLPFHFNDPSPLKKSIETQYAFIYLSKPVGKHYQASRMTINVETCRHKKGAKIMLITRVVKHHKANTFHYGNTVIFSFTLNINA